MLAVRRFVFLDMNQKARPIAFAQIGQDWEPQGTNALLHSGDAAFLTKSDEAGADL